jgi:hypothetical protein
MTAGPAEPAGKGAVRRRGMVWVAGLVVALGAGVATAHGLYGVATAARVPAPIAWLYPLITDGLALVAYAATARLTEAGRRYAWTVVVLAAGLSGLAQASYLAGGVHAAAAGDGSGLATALRFGVGAWPALAAAIVAHLLHLLDTATPIGPAGTAAQPLTPTGQAGPEPITEYATAEVNAVRPASDSALGTDRTGTDVGGTGAIGTAATDGDVAGRGAAINAGKATRTDEELLAVLAGMPRPVSVRAAVRELGVGVRRARRLMAATGLLSVGQAPAGAGGVSSGVVSSGVLPSGQPHQPTLPEDEPDQPEDSSQDRRALHIVSRTPEARSDR